VISSQVYVQPPPKPIITSRVVDVRQVGQPLNIIPVNSVIQQEPQVYVQQPVQEIIGPSKELPPEYE
jgi:hypothetical protein